MIPEYLISFLTFTLIYIIIVVSLNLSVGFTGLINLGHMVFFGIGAYSSALFTINGIPWPLAVILSALIASIFGIMISVITVRLKGDYLAMVTLGLIFIAVAISRNWISLTRGALGIPGVPDIIRNNGYYLLFVFLLTVLTVMFFKWLTKTQTGKIFQAIRDDEIAASTLGKNTYFYKILSIAISTSFAGLAGSLFVHHLNFVDPSVFDIEFFVFIIAMLITGGLASIKGSIVGAIVLGSLAEAIRFVPFSPLVIGALRDMLFMSLLIVILIFRPKGIFGKVDV